MTRDRHRPPLYIELLTKNKIDQLPRFEKTNELFESFVVIYFMMKGIKLAIRLFGVFTPL